MSLFTVNVALPRTVQLTICARNEWVAQYAAIEFVETAFMNALAMWDERGELIRDEDDQPLVEVSVSMPREGQIELAPNAVEITAR